MKKRTFLFLLIIFFTVVIFFHQFFLHGLLPIPADTIVGLYHPYRDMYAKNYPNGIPFKNFLITDPVRQQYPWRELAISLEKQLQFPLWNPYSFAGTPLLATFQSAVLYPLNIFFFLLPFPLAWTFLIFLEPLLSGVFMFLFLRNLKLTQYSSLLGSIAFAFSGFFVAWMEWGTIVHVGLWLPLILLAIDKILFGFYSSPNSKFKIQKYLLWSVCFVVAICCSFLAGHLQTFFYVSLVSLSYFLLRWIQFGKKKNSLFLFLILTSCFLLLTSIQWIPLFQFISFSALNLNTQNCHQQGCFLPYQHLVQFIVPDFFGNPTTLNYFGVWNYGEMVGYVSLLPLIMSFNALLFRRDKKTLYFGIILISSLIFALPTFIAKLPFQFNVPFIATAQPTRLLFLIDFSLCVLGALGFDYFIKLKKNIFYPIGIVLLFFLGAWIFVLSTHILKPNDVSVVNNNLLLPTILFGISSVVLLFITLLKQRFSLKVQKSMYILLLGILIFDLIRFAQKFETFTNKNYLYPSTAVVQFLQTHLGTYRFMTIDNRILPPNFQVHYHLQSINGYDPLYLRQYGNLLTAISRNSPDISHPINFNRILVPDQYENPLINLLGVKYVLSLTDLQNPRLQKVFQEGQTRVYENRQVLPRAFFVRRIYTTHSDQTGMKILFANNSDLNNSAAVQCDNCDQVSKRFSNGKISIVHYSENKVTMQSENTNDGFLVLTDSYY